MQLILGALLIANSFNLICSGNVEISDATPRTEAYTVQYRVNLDTNQWCQGDCSTVESIYEVEDGELTLRYERDIQVRVTDAILLNRVTGAHFATEHSIDDGLIMRTFNGKCETAPFTPFPRVRQKF